MKAWHWTVLGLPTTCVLFGWSHNSQAADILIEFEKAVAPSKAVDPSKKESAALATSIPPEDHRLNFAPPQVIPEASDLQAVDLPPETSQSPLETLEDAPLSVPDAFIPTDPKSTTELPPPPLSAEIADLFEGGIDSLVARAVGSAEGTRTPHGQKKLAYYGHIDPGNQAWNQGTFSYQHAAQSPEEADQKQLERLKGQTTELHRLASHQGLNLTTEEILNGIDLANQAPIAALDRGYIDWLAQAKAMGLQSKEAILWARTRSFLDPDTGRWNAPGLGNSVHTITQDQARRQRAISAAIAVNVQPQEPVRSHLAPYAVPFPTKPPETKADKIDVILHLDLPEL